jgi:pyruvate dehydrogenase E2 component (dihydrolipoamide acetyltransferase)
VSLTSDHRVVDGSDAAAFTYEVIRHLEDPSLLFLHTV